MKPNLVKTQAVIEWPTLHPRNIFSSSLAWRFICNYSQLASSLTSLPSSKISFVWFTEAKAPFIKLKEVFTSAPILLHPDTKKQFIVKVDAFEFGVGPLLFQRLGLKVSYSFMFSSLSA